MFGVGKFLGGISADGSRAARASHQSYSRIAPRGLRRRSCFVVDDDEQTRRVITAVIDGLGAVSTEMASGDELTTALDRFMPTLVFMDINLRDSDAVETFRGLAARKYAGAVQLVSGQHPQLVAAVHAIGLKNHLTMLPPIEKPFAVSAIRDIAKSQFEADEHGVLTEDLAVDLDLALQKGWIELWYQPKIDLRRRRLAGLSASPRVRHPDYGIVLPSEFMKRASRPSTRRLIEYMIVSVLREWQQLRQIGSAPKTAIHISVDALAKLDIAKMLRELQPTQSDWPGFVFELTEDHAVRDFEIIRETAAQLMIYGVSFSLDEFGAGYSSLNLLKEFMVSEVSLSTTIAADCAKSNQSFLMCQSLVNLAHSANALTTGKAVEDQEALAALYKTGCDIAQGPVLCRPMPVPELLTYLRVKAQTQRRIMSGGSVAPAVNSLTS